MKEVTDTARWERLDWLSNAEGVVNHTASELHLFGHYHSGSWDINLAIIWINIVVAMKISYFSSMIGNNDNDGLYCIFNAYMLLEQN